MNKDNFLKQPINRICFILIAIFSCLIFILIGSSKVCYQGKCLFDTRPEVKEFSWENQKVGATDKAFYLVFDRPMSHDTVEQNLVIEPNIDGRISWAGKRLVYTLNDVITYGRDYRLSLSNAQEKFRGQKKLGAKIEPFVAEFQSRERAFAYIGSKGEESGRLILNNSTKLNKTILTPANLIVIDFKFTPNNEKIVFSALNNKENNSQIKKINLYQVETGLSNDSTTRVPGKVQLILDAEKYQNNKFDLAGDDGEIVVVQRVNHQNAQDYDLWKLEAGKIPQRLNTKGGDFVVTPDGKSVAIAQGEGISILPLSSQENQNKSSTVNFLPKYGQVLTFSNDGGSAAMINFNKDDSQLQFTRSLFYVNNQGVEKELLNIKGNIIDCKFGYKDEQLFCLLTEIQENELEETLQERPYFASINLESGKVVPLIALPKYQDIKISMAPDGLRLLFDQLVTENDISEKTLKDIAPAEELLTDSAELIVSSRLWLLSLPTTESPQAKLEELPIVGFKPQWSR